MQERKKQLAEIRCEMIVKQFKLSTLYVYHVLSMKKHSNRLESGEELLRFYVIFPSLLPFIGCAIAIHADRQNGLPLLLLCRCCSYKVHIIFVEFHLKCWGRCEACEIHSACQWIEANIEHNAVRCLPPPSFEWCSLWCITHATHKFQITFNDIWSIRRRYPLHLCQFLRFLTNRSVDHTTKLNNIRWNARVPLVYIY